MSKNPATKPNYKDLLLNALNPENEKKISDAYRVFHNYSITNQMLAVQQMDEISPIATYKKWNELGRQVKKGSKAIALYMPVQVKELDENGKETGEKKTIFIIRRNWFSMAQTEGENVEIEAVKMGEWNALEALKTLNIEKTEFDTLNGNSQGFATGRKVAINPIAENPFKTLVHEIAHIELGHTSEDDQTPKAIKEVEAESVAFIAMAILQRDSEFLANSRGYIQSWLGNNELDEKSARRIFSTANKIIKAGTKTK